MNQQRQINYYEYILTAPNKNIDSNIPPGLSWNIDIGKDKFTEILQKLSKQEYKYFQREYKEIVYNDITFQSFTNNETKIFKLLPLTHDFIGNSILSIGYQKQKLSLVNVPSTAQPHNITYVKQLIFRITNRIYLCMLVKKEMEGSFTYSAVVNYNHEYNVDMNLVDRHLQKIFKVLQ